MKPFILMYYLILLDSLFPDLPVLPLLAKNRGAVDLTRSLIGCKGDLSSV